MVSWRATQTNEHRPAETNEQRENAILRPPSLCLLNPTEYWAPPSITRGGCSEGEEEKGRTEVLVVEEEDEEEEEEDEGGE